jgi:hypothetical protein
VTERAPGSPRGASVNVVIASVSAVAIAVGAWAVAHAIDHNDGTATAAVAVAPAAVSTPTTVHTHAASAAVDDRGFSQLENGSQHSHAFTQPISTADRVLLAHQLEVTRQVALQYPTIADAIAGGYHRVGPFIPGLGAHYMKSAEIMQSLDPDGVVDDNDLRHPIMLIYDGTQPTSHVAGLMYYSMAKTEPQGFAGPNDVWHIHKNLCLVYSSAGIDLPLGADQDVTKAQCDQLHGQLLTQSNYMVHVWSVPGYESDLGVFSHTSPALTCPDGTYYSVPLSSDIGNRVSLCRDAAA